VYSLAVSSSSETVLAETAGSDGAGRFDNAYSYNKGPYTKCGREASMATTYDRIRTLLEEVKRNESAGNKARDYFDLSTYLASREIREFLIDAEEKRFLSAAALRKLLRLLKDLGLVAFGDAAILTAAGKQALQGNNYDRMVSTAALEFLSKSYDITLASIHDVIASVTLPEVPESEVIFKKLSNPRKNDLGFDRFRTLLFLLHCTHRLDRELKVLYGKRKATR
jgi:hypothetical protein